MSVWSGWKVQEMNAVKPPVSSWSRRTRSKCSTRSSIVSTWPNIIVAVERPPSWCQTRWTSSQSSVRTLPARDRLADAVDQDLRPAAGQAPQPRGLEPLQDLPQRHPGHLGEEVDLRRAEAVDVDPGEVRLDVAKQLLVPLELRGRGCRPPCIRIWSPPSSTVSRIFSSSTSRSRTYASVSPTLR